jgi:thiol-disulfide isomerase/thioredoxin
MRAFLFTLLFLFGVTLVAIAQSAPAKGPELKAITTPDQIAPQPKVIGAEAEVVLKNVFGVEQKLSALRGRVVVLNFWATYCGPCVKEMPELVAIQNQYAAFGVQVVGASLDTLAERKEVRKFITDMKINFPVWLGATTEDLARFGLGSAIPSTVVIGRDGKIVAVFRRAIRQADLRRQLNALIASRGSR